MKTLTENKMVTNPTSMNANVDLFFMAGATRHWTEDKIINLFENALKEDSLTAMKILFRNRDIRGGAGERRFFRICLDYLNKNHSDFLVKNAHLIPEFGRWDDLFVTEKSVFIPILKKGYEDKNGLSAKWTPRKGDIANTIRKELGLSPKDYRKLIVGLSKTVEQQMCAKKFDEIVYEQVPSCAMNKYRNAFYRNDEERFKSYIGEVKSGTKSIKAGAIYPHQLYQALRKSGLAKNGSFKIEPNEAIEAQWKALPNYMEGSTEKIMPMIDVSPSMKQFGELPMDVSISLGLYISERNEGIFKDAVITFSENPKMEFLKGNFVERATQMRYANWGGSTNLEAAFDLLIKKAIKYDISQDEMPTKFLIISDMQFNQASKVDQSALEMIKEKFEDVGYEMPSIIFWNVRAEETNVPASVSNMGVGLVSGFSPSILKVILQGKVPEKENPMDLMLRAINDERYSSVTI